MTRHQGIYRRAAPLSPDRPVPNPWPEVSSAR
jgi:hypothetical protein